MVRMDTKLTSLVVTALFFIGCTQQTDRNLDFWDVGPRSTADVNDAFDSSETNDAGDTPPGEDSRDVPGTDGDAGDIDPPPRDELFVPKPPLDNTLCEDGWCWLHPRPFPHDVVELQRVGDEIYGAAKASLSRTAIPFIWRETGLSFPERPIQVPRYYPNGLGDVDIGKEGWIQLAGGHLVEYGPDGLTKARSLPSEFNRHLSANSADDFIAFYGGQPIRARDGVVSAWESMPGSSTGAKLWPNGDIWQVGRTEEKQTPGPNYIRVFPDPEGTNASVNVFGPDPETACASEGVWGAGHPRSLYRWQPMAGSWQSIGPTASTFFPDILCVDGDLVAVDAAGALYRRTGDGWEQHSISDVRLGAAASRGGTVYAGGVRGELVKLENGQRHSPTAGFRVPANDRDDSTPTHVLDLWVSEDERKAAIMTPSGLYRTSKDGWFRQTSGLPDGINENSRVDLYGEQEPTFLVADRTLYLWTGNSFRKDILPNPDDEPRPTIVDVEAAGGGSYWAATRANLYKFDGGGWSLVTRRGHPVDDFLERENLSIEATYHDGHGDLLIAIDENLYRLTGGGTEWTFTRESGLPCEDVRSMHRDENETLYIESITGCAAKLDGDWSPIQAEGDIGFVEGFVEDPESPRPIVISDRGIFKFNEEGNLRQTSAREVQKVEYLPFSDALISVNHLGVLINYDSKP